MKSIYEILEYLKEDGKKDQHSQIIEPNRIDRFIGQDNFKKIFKPHVNESMTNGKSFPHTLLFGQPGLGKTELSRSIALVFNSAFLEFSAPSLKLGDIKDLCNNDLKPNDVIFLDEIHGLNKKCAEELYTPLQDFKYNGFTINPFTLIGATTDSGLLPKPLRDRFKIEYTFEPYANEEIEKIIFASYPNLSSSNLEQIAQRSFGIPRVALKYAMHAKAFLGSGIEFEKLFTILDIDEQGLSLSHRKILAFMKFVKKPIGVDALSMATSISKSDIVGVYEPDLISMGLMTRSTKGRELTNGGKNYKFK